jgi:hypothetical protein
MDRSIDEARQRRLDDEDPDHTPGGGNHSEPLTDSDHSSGASSANGTNGHTNGSATNGHIDPARPASKYGRATPIRETPPTNSAKWREA